MIFYWIAIAVLFAGVVISYVAHEKRLFPAIIAVLGGCTLYAHIGGYIGVIGMVIITILAIVVWFSNTISDRFR